MFNPFQRAHEQAESWPFLSLTLSRRRPNKRAKGEKRIGDAIQCNTIFSLSVDSVLVVEGGKGDVMYSNKVVRYSKVRVMRGSWGKFEWPKVS